MANPQPPYSDITGISRTVMKDNAQESIANYNGNARPGEMVVDLTNNDVYIGNVNGGLSLISTASGSGNADPAGPTGAVQVNAGGGLFGGTSALVVSGTTLSIGGNITPQVDNIYSLGSEDYRWKSVHIGPGSLYISNTVSNVSAVLTVDGSTLKVLGVPQLAVGQLSFVENTIESTTGNIDLQIGQIAATANIVLNRNTVLAAGKTFGLVDTGTGIVAKLSVTDGVLEIDGANQLQVGQLKFIDNTIESTTGNINIEIGDTGDSANLILNRNTVMAAGKTLKIGNDTVVTEVVTAFDPQFRDIANTFAGGTVTGTYVLQNSMCYFQIRVEFAGTTNYGNSQYQITLPFPADGNYTSRNGTLHQIGSGGGSGANTLYHIGGHIDSETSNTIMKLSYFQTASDLPWKFNTPGGVPPGGTNAYWAVAGDAHFDINGQYLIAQ